jgi:hypothetical protein
MVRRGSTVRVRQRGFTKTPGNLDHVFWTSRTFGAESAPWGQVLGTGARAYRPTGNLWGHIDGESGAAACGEC